MILCVPHYLSLCAAAMSTKPFPTTDWSFSFRTINPNVYSDSDSDTDSVHLNEAQLINDLDLSSREETVLYKPNPFSISKINAASRAQNACNGITYQQQPTKEKASLKGKATGPKANIPDGFKKQAEKAQSQSLRVSALKPGLVTPKPRAADEPRGVLAKDLAKATNGSLLSTTTSTNRPNSACLSALSPKHRPATNRPGARAQLSTATVTPVLPVISIAALPARSFTAPPSPHETSCRDPNIASGNTPSPSASPSNSGSEHTHILTQSTTTPQSHVKLPARSLIGKFSSPLPSPASVPSYRLRHTKNPPIPAPNQSTLDILGPVPQPTTGLAQLKRNFRPQHGGPFSSPILPPSSRFLSSNRPQDNINANHNTRAFTRPPTLIPMQFSPLLRPSDSYTHAHASARTLDANVSAVHVFPSRALDFVRPSRVEFPRNGSGLQLQRQRQIQLLSGLDPPFEYDTQHRPQPRIRRGMATDASRGFFLLLLLLVIMIVYRERQL